jgi:hypothetical protein
MNSRARPIRLVSYHSLATPDFGKSSGLYFAPGNYVILIGKMVCETAVKFSFLRLGQRWRGTTTYDTIPNCLNQFNLLIYVKYTSLFQELRVHNLIPIKN